MQTNGDTFEFMMRELFGGEWKFLKGMRSYVIHSHVSDSFVATFEFPGVRAEELPKSIQEIGKAFCSREYHKKKIKEKDDEIAALKKELENIKLGINFHFKMEHGRDLQWT